MRGEALEILHVEDNPDHAHLVKRSLARHRVANRIRLLEDGEAALEYLFHRGEFQDHEANPRPDLVLLDLRLPKVDGLEVLRVIKTTEPLQQIPVVILTSSDAERDVAQAYGHFANSYLVKPVGFDQFTDMMEQLGFYWLCWNHYPWSTTVS